MNNIKDKLKDFVLIARIKVSSFVRKHKYISSFIGLFFVSFIVALIAFAEEDQYAGKIKATIDTQNIKVTDMSLTSTESLSTVKSFSTIIYDIPYHLSLTDGEMPEGGINNRSVIIEATYAGDYDLVWIKGDESATYTIDNDNKKVTISVNQISLANANSKKIYLRVGNVPNGSQVNVTAKIYEATSTSLAETSVSLPTVNVESREVTLTAKVLPGKAYKNTQFTGGRYAPFGIMLGIDGETSLKGLYFNPDKELTLEGLQTIGNSATFSEIELETNSDFYGTYNRNQKLFDMPNYINDMIEKSVYNSGSVDSLNISASGASGESNDVENPEVYLIGLKMVNIEAGDTYKEEGIKIGAAGTATCKTSSTSCTRTIKNSLNETTTDVHMLSTAGEYTITYTYVQGDTEIVLKRKISVANKTEVAVDDNNYKLSGNKNVILIKDAAYTETGVLKNNNTAFTGDTDADYIVSYKLNDESVDDINTSNVGTYEISYLISSKTSDQQATLKRYVTVYEALPTTVTSIVKTSSLIMPASDTLPVLNISIDNSSVECNLSNSCEIDYYDANNNLLNTPPANLKKAATYILQYKVTDSNGFVIKLKNTLKVQIKYTLKISNIKTDGSYYKDGTFMALGSYFVTAKSQRLENETSDIKVYLKVDENLSSESMNYYHSAGTKTLDFSVMKETANGLEKINRDYYDNSTEYYSLAYGEEAILKSEFSYSVDADDDLNNFELYISVAEGLSSDLKPRPLFDMIEYYNENSETPYYVESNVVLENLTVNYIGCTKQENEMFCSNKKRYESYEEFKEAQKKEPNLILAYVTYKVKRVTPGTTIDFRVRGITKIGNRNTDFHMYSDAYTYTIDSLTEEIISQQHIADKHIKVNITPFKARTEIYVNDKNQDVIIDGANVSTSTLSFYPSVTMPAQMVNTNAAGIQNIEEILVKISLPAGINIIYNDDYIKPVTSSINSSGTTLIYAIKNTEINEWLEPIKIDIAYDITIPNGSELEISAETSATVTKGTADDILDNSTLGQRTSKRKITYINSERISFGQSTPYSAISKNGSFDITTKLYNNSLEAMSNLQLVTLLPYNDVSLEEGYTGTYELSNLPTGALCTTALQANILDENKLLSNTDITWEDCSDYATTKYEGITAIKVGGINLESGASYQDTFKITTFNNKTDDKYVVSSTLIYNNITKNINPTTVSIVSKRITGIVWEDFDANGLMDIEEVKIKDVTLNLYDATTNEIVTTTTTDANGKYSLGDLTPGTYYVTAEYNKVKYGLSPVNISEDKSISSIFTSVEVPVEDDESTETLEITIKTPNIEISENTRSINNINLGLALRKVYTVKLNKYISKVLITNRLGITTTKDLGNVSLAKLDVKDVSNISIKVIYTIELENTGYYPGYIYTIKDYIPDGMSFDEKDELNKGWKLNSAGHVENSTLFDQLIKSGDKKYLTLALNVTRKEAGSFINSAVVEDEDLHILTVAQGDESGEGDSNE